ncbi:MAG: hypothetical protein A2V52_02550 [Actinobacteria bacterium RBG_19FT_COMBO_54_7]|nr:MAG: hypothetical protein A2W01_01410 [Candidatus Solincola sediminis]OFW69854.1 MAG: hypothetical protein A2V52_02550 [Actinobacteria bacterium RBG_19FT_COMBO_54_7]
MRRFLFLALFIMLLTAIAILPGCAGTGAPEGAVEAEVPHFTDSTPLKNEVYAAQPINVTLNFDLALEAGSDISVISEDGREWVENILIEDNDTALKGTLGRDMPDGEYSLSYTARLVDGSANHGGLSFSIDSNLQQSYQDLRAEGEVVVGMSNLKFIPEKTMIKPGTRVTWVNNEDAEHFINTETHPEHTYYPPQNSLGITRGASFSVVFDIPGQYNYHCSAHYGQGMVGSIIVANP